MPVEAAVVWYFLVKDIYTCHQRMRIMWFKRLRGIQWESFSENELLTFKCMVVEELEIDFNVIL